MAGASGRITPAAPDIGVEFREAMGRLAAGIVMVTTVVDGRPWGLTVSACCSISMLPPTIAVSLSDSTVSVRTIQQEGVFGVSILGERLIEAAQFGSVRGAPKFVDRFCAQDGRESATPALKSAIAHLDCRLARAVHVADHVVLFGEVGRVLRDPDEDHALVYHDRRYHRLSFTSDIRAAPAPDLWW